jgi:dolichyl-diphosphooligosaccharide--protein glycosyltransferase
MNWWDFGHWISAYGHRIPIANGMQAGAAEAARFFTATDPGEAAQILRRNGARYVVADASMPLHPGGGSFLPMLSWAGLDAGKFVEVYESHGLPVTVFYPAWYESMLARLYLFDGQPQTPRSSTWVFEFAGGEKPRRIVSQRAFDSYGEAQAYVKEHASPNIVIGGLNPMQSCVPLSRLGGYRLAYNSQPLQAVKVFEYTP